MSDTNKTPMQATRERKRASGLERVEVWVRPEWKGLIRKLAKLLNEETE
jgi:hypothetical protein